MISISSVTVNAAQKDNNTLKLSNAEIQDLRKSFTEDNLKIYLNKLEIKSKTENTNKTSIKVGKYFTVTKTSGSTGYFSINKKSKFDGIRPLYNPTTGTDGNGMVWTTYDVETYLGMTIAELTVKGYFECDGVSVWATSCATSGNTKLAGWSIERFSSSYSPNESTNYSIATGSFVLKLSLVGETFQTVNETGTIKAYPSGSWSASWSA